MLIETLRKIFKRDLENLEAEIRDYQNESNLWIVDAYILNSGGNLCLHLVGNLNAFIGAALGNTGYVRNREAEFSDKNVPKATLLEKIKETQKIVDNTLEGLTEARLQQNYPLKVFNTETSTEYFLVHLAAHLSYHLGQLNYHRRLLDV